MRLCVELEPELDNRIVWKIEVISLSLTSSSRGLLFGGVPVSVKSGY